MAAKKTSKKISKQTSKQTRKQTSKQAAAGKPEVTPAEKASAEKTTATKTETRKAPARPAQARKTPARVARQPIADRTTDRIESGEVRGPVVTTIVANFDAGFGNALFIRGAGADLNWDAGADMECIGPQEWRYSTTGAVDLLEVKFLINDDAWSVGDNVVVPAGEEVVVAPIFG